MNITDYQIAAAELRQQWLDQPENQRPERRNVEAMNQWHQRWLTSEEKAQLDALWLAYSAGVMRETANHKHQ